LVVVVIINVDDHHLAKYEDELMLALDTAQLMAATFPQIAHVIQRGSVGGRHHQRRRSPPGKV